MTQLRETLVPKEAAALEGAEVVEKPPKPTPVVVNVEAIPAALKDRAQWICWRWVWNGKKWDKPPYRADGRGKASSTDAGTWATFAAAEAAYRRGGFDGIGFALSEDDPFCMVDLDKCLGESWAVEKLETLNSYTETTPSGNGYHSLIEADASGMAKKSKDFHGGHVEVYDRGRYMTVTGQRLEAFPAEILPRQRELEAACAPLVRKPGKPVQPTTPERDSAPMGDAEALDTLFRIKPKVRDLYNGNGSGDASGDDQSLCNELAWITGSNAATMDRLFRQSGLMRPKWDERHRGDGATYGQMTIEKAIEGTRSHYTPGGCSPDDFADAGEPEAMEPVDLFGNLEPPEFPIYLMPRSIARYAADQAELMGVDPAIIAMGALTVVASCIDDRIKIQPKRHDPTWTESARLWVAPVGDPSTMKSPGLSKAMSPAYSLEAEWRKGNAELMAQYQKDCKKAAKSKDDDADEPAHPVLKRLIFEDTTVEKMGDLLAKCEPRGCLVFRDELTGWLASMDAYKNGGGKDRAQWLEAYNGGSLMIDRVHRGSTLVENWSACVLGGIQPSVIHEYAKVTNHDGMLQRFIILFAREAAYGVDRRPDMDAKRDYSEMVEQVANLRHGGEPVRLSDAAHDVKEVIWAKLHTLAKRHPNPFLSAALAKWKGTYARLLLTFHAGICAESGVYPSAQEVTADTAQRVADLMWCCLLPHAVRFYQELDDTEDKARAVAGLILARKWERFTVKRDLDRNLRNSRRWKPWELDEAMQRLESFNWIVPIPGKLNERGRPSAYTINPLVHERFNDVAEKERQRREEVAKTMQELAAGPKPKIKTETPSMADAMDPFDDWED